MASKQLTDHFFLACTSALVMFACAAGYGSFVVFENSAKPGAYLGIIVGLPAVATILYLLITYAVPNLLAPKKLVFPLMITLPLVFQGLLFLSVILITSTGNGLVIPYEKLRVARFWEAPMVLVLVGASQMVCLSVLSMLTSRPVE